MAAIVAQPSALVPEPAPPAVVEEQRYVLRNVHWHVYVSLHDSLELAGAGVRMTYLAGALEFRSPLLDETTARSTVLPDLDVALLSTFVELGESQTKLVKAYRAALRSPT